LVLMLMAGLLPQVMWIIRRSRTTVVCSIPTSTLAWEASQTHKV